MTTINASEKIFPIFSIIIISFNTRDVTINCLQSIFDSVTAEKSTFFTKYKLQIIVVDNASSDGSPQAIEEFFQENTHESMTCHLVKNADNIGFGKANNQGVQMAKGEYIFLLNSDTLVIENALEKFFDFYIQNENTKHFMGAKLLNGDKTPQPSAAPFYTPAIVFAALFLKGDYYGVSRYSPDHVKKVGWVSGACILTKKNYFQEIGGFDKDIFMYMEEVDLLYRAKQKGFDTYFFPDAQFIHFGSLSSGGKTYPILQVYKGFLFFYKKHYSPLANVLLRNMLKLKALISIFIGKITKNQYLTETYGKAYSIASMD